MSSLASKHNKRFCSFQAELQHLQPGGCYNGIKAVLISQEAIEAQKIEG